MTTIARRMSILLLATFLTTSSLTAQQQIRAVGSSADHFASAAVEAGDYVYVSGQGPHGADGTMPSGFGAQFRQCLQNLKAVLSSAGLTLDNVVYMQVYVTDMSSYAEMNRVFREYFPNTPPARAVLGVYALPNASVVVNAIAVRNADEKKAVYPAGFAKNDVASPGILTRDQLFISSLAGIDPATGKIPDDPAAQVDLALDRMTAVVKAAGLEMSHVVFVNPYLTAGHSRPCDESALCQTFRVWQYTSSCHDTSVELAGRGSHRIHRHSRSRPSAAQSSAAQEYASQSDRQSLCFRRRHPLLFSEKRIHSGTP